MMAVLSDQQRKFYETVLSPDFNTPGPWNQGPRRMGTDKNDDVLWVGNSWGGSLARIDTRTNATTLFGYPTDYWDLSRRGLSVPRRAS